MFIYLCCFLYLSLSAASSEEYLHPISFRVIPCLTSYEKEFGNQGQAVWLLSPSSVSSGPATPYTLAWPGDSSRMPQ